MQVVHPSQDFDFGAYDHDLMIIFIQVLGFWRLDDVFKHVLLDVRISSHYVGVNEYLLLDFDPQWGVLINKISDNGGDLLNIVCSIDGLEFLR